MAGPVKKKKPVVVLLTKKEALALFKKKKKPYDDQRLVIRKQLHYSYKVPSLEKVQRAFGKRKGYSIRSKKYGTRRAFAAKNVLTKDEMDQIQKITQRLSKSSIFQGKGYLNKEPSFFKKLFEKTKKKFAWLSTKLLEKTLKKIKINFRSKLFANAAQKRLEKAKEEASADAAQKKLKEESKKAKDAKEKEEAAKERENATKEVNEQLNNLNGHEENLDYLKTKPEYLELKSKLLDLHINGIQKIKKQKDLLDRAIKAQEAVAQFRRGENEKKILKIQNERKIKDYRGILKNMGNFARLSEYRDNLKQIENLIKRVSKERGSKERPIVIHD